MTEECENQFPEERVGPRNPGARVLVEILYGQIVKPPRRCVMKSSRQTKIQFNLGLTPME